MKLHNERQPTLYQRRRSFTLNQTHVTLREPRNRPDQRLNTSDLVTWKRTRGICLRTVKCSNRGSLRCKNRPKARFGFARLITLTLRPVWFTPRDVRGSENATLCVGQLFQLGFNLFFDLYRCSVQRLHWIFCESIWKRHFRYNINEPYKCPGREISYTCTKSLNLCHYTKWFSPIVLHKINK